MHFGTPVCSTVSRSVTAGTTDGLHIRTPRSSPFVARTCCCPVKRLNLGTSWVPRPAPLYLQPAVRRPLSRLMTRTTNPTIRSKWIRPPPICRLKPRSHKIRRTARTVQSMSTSYFATPKHESHLVRVRVVSCERMGNAASLSFASALLALRAACNTSRTQTLVNMAARQVTPQR